MSERLISPASEEAKPSFGETTNERRTESLLRHAAAWEADFPEPENLTYRALMRKGILSPTQNRRPPLRYGFAFLGWSGGSLVAAAMLTVLLYARPFPSAEAPSPARTGTTTRNDSALNSLTEPAPATREIATAQRAPSDAALPKAVTPPATKRSPESAPRYAKASRSRSPGFVSGRRRLRLSRRHTPKAWLARRKNLSIRNAPGKNGENAAPEIAANPASGAMPNASLAPQDYRALIPIVLTYESEDGSEVIAAPAVVEVAYN